MSRTPGGAAAVTLVDLDGVDWSSPDARAALVTAAPPLRVGVSSEVLPPESAAVLESLLFTVAPGGPGRSWVDAGREPDVGRADPGVARVLDDVLSLTSTLPVRQGLVVESLAYSALLAGPVFRGWRAATPRGPVPEDDDPVLLRREGGVLHVSLNRPLRHNAFGRAVRDGLLAALELATLDDSVRQVALDGVGPSFCSGGDLDEFGTTPDVVTAHGLRLDLSAGWAVHRLRDRVRPHLHGVCLGAGIEVPAFADHVVAAVDSTFALPEMRFGLVPGAGGTVSVTKRIGRWRTAYLALTGEWIDGPTALRWGLVDELV